MHQLDNQAAVAEGEKEGGATSSEAPENTQAPALESATGAVVKKQINSQSELIRDAITPPEAYH